MNTLQGTILNSDYERFEEVFPEGSKVRCECEWQPRKWMNGIVSHHKNNAYGMPQWIFIEMEDGSSAEYDYRYIDVEDFRNSLVRPVK